LQKSDIIKSSLTSLISKKAMTDKIELLEDIKLAEEQITLGKGISHSKVKKMFLRLLVMNGYAWLKMRRK